MPDLEILNPLPTWVTPEEPIAHPLIVWCSRKKYLQHRDDFLWVTMRLSVDGETYSGPISTFLNGPNRTQDRVDIRERIALPFTGPPTWNNPMFFTPAASGHIFAFVTYLWTQRFDSMNGNGGDPTYRAPELLETYESVPIGVREAVPNKPLIDFPMPVEEKKSRDGKVQHVWELLQLQRNGQPIPQNWLPKSEREAGSIHYDTQAVGAGASVITPPGVVSQVHVANDFDELPPMGPELYHSDTSNYDTNHGSVEDWPPGTGNPAPWATQNSESYFCCEPVTTREYALEDDYDDIAFEGWPPSHPNSRQGAPPQSGRTHAPYRPEPSTQIFIPLEDAMDAFSPFYESPGLGFSQPRSWISQPSPEFFQPRPRAGNQTHYQGPNSRVPSHNSGRQSNIAEHNARYGVPPRRYGNPRQRSDNNRQRAPTNQRPLGGNHGRCSTHVSYHSAYSMTPPDGFTDHRQRGSNNGQRARLNVRLTGRPTEYTNGSGVDPNVFM